MISDITSILPVVRREPPTSVYLFGGRDTRRRRGDRTSRRYQVLCKTAVILGVWFTSGAGGIRHVFREGFNELKAQKAAEAGVAARPSLVPLQSGRCVSGKAHFIPLPAPR